MNRRTGEFLNEEANPLREAHLSDEFRMQSAEWNATTPDKFFHHPSPTIQTSVHASPPATTQLHAVEK